MLNKAKGKDSSTRDLLYLLKERFLTMLSHKWTFSIYVACFGIITILEFVGIRFCAVNGYGTTPIVVLQIVNALLIVVIDVTLVVSMFKIEKDNNVISFEQREGYSRRNIYLARIIEIIAAIVLLLIVQIVINMIIIGAAKGFNDPFWYKMYAISLGWYAMVALVGTSLTLFIMSFTNQIAAIILSAVIMVAMLIVTLVCGVTNPGQNENPSSLVTFQDIRNNNISHFMKNELGIKTKSDWDNVNKAYHIGAGYDTMWNGGPKDVGNIWEWVKHIGFYSNGDKYTYRMFGTYGIDSKNMTSFNNQLIGYRKYSQFLDDENDFFKNHLKNVSYSKVQYWDAFSSASGLKKLLSQEDTTSNEPIKLIINEISNSDFGKKYGFGSLLKPYTSLNTMLTVTNLYPRFLASLYKWGFNNEGPNSGSELIGYDKKIEATGINPAEIIFNKYLGWMMDQASKSNTFLDKPATINTKEVKYTTRNMCYNPATQWEQMLNGVSYRNEQLNDLLSSYKTDIGQTTSVLRAVAHDDGTITYYREAHIEPVYIIYIVVNALLAYAGYWIYRKEMVH